MNTVRFDPNPSGFITSWLICRPFPNPFPVDEFGNNFGSHNRATDRSGFDVDYLIEEGGEASLEPYEGMAHFSSDARNQRVEWMLSEANLSPLYDRDDYYTRSVDFDYPPRLTEHNFIVYAACTIESPVEERALLRLGSTAGVKVWWNHELMHDHYIDRWAHPDDDSVEVHVRKGANVCVVKLEENLYKMRFYLRLTDLDGTAMTDLKVALPLRPGLRAMDVHRKLVLTPDRKHLTPALEFFLLNTTGESAGPVEVRLLWDGIEIGEETVEQVEVGVPTKGNLRIEENRIPTDADPFGSGMGELRLRWDDTEQVVPVQKSLILSTTFRGLLGRLDLEQRGLEKVREAAAREEYDAARRELVGYIRRKFMPPAEERARAVERLTARSESILAQADASAAHRFGGEELGDPIDWYSLYIETRHSLSISCLSGGLGEAYWLTGDRRYADTFERTMLDWLSSCPQPRHEWWMKPGHPWHGLTVTGRLSTLRSNFRYFGGSEDLQDDTSIALFRAIGDFCRYLHAIEVRVGVLSSNHQLHHSNALLHTALAFPEFVESEAWRDMAISLFVAHLDRTVYPDGAHIEVCPGYHTGALHEFASTLQICRDRGIELPEWYAGKLEKMWDFIEALTKPDGTAPAIGDSGRRDTNELFREGAALFDRPDFEYLSDREKGKEPPFTSIRLPHANYLVMRTGWAPEDLYLLLDCAPFHAAQFASGHSHADALNIIVYAYGKSLIMDPGSLGYDHPQHIPYILRTHAHNAMAVDGMDSLGQDQGDPTVLDWVHTPGFDFAAGEADFPRAVCDRHRREVFFVRGEYWILHDTALGTGTHTLERLFHFPAGSEVRIRPDDATTRVTVEDTAGILIVPVEGHRAAVERHAGPMHTKGGVEDAPYLSIGRKGTAPAAFDTVLYPFRAEEEPSLRITRLSFDPEVPEHEACALRIETGSVTDYYAISHTQEGVRRFGAFATDAHIAYVRRDASNGLVRVWMKEGTHIEERGRTLVKSSAREHAVEVAFDGQTVDVRGDLIGRLSVLASDAKSVRLNGNVVRLVREKEGYIRLG